ncbi:MAG: DsbA family protein [Pseudomonadota bacterium]
MAGPSRTLSYSLIGVAGVAVIAAVGYFLAMPTPDGGDAAGTVTATATDTAAAAAAISRPAPASGPLGVVEDGDMILGDADAPVTVVEYASLTCPHCGRFHQSVFPELREQFVDTGKVRFVFREVYFDQLGLFAGRVAQCAGAERYFGMVGILLENQQTWIKPGDVTGSLFEVTKYGLLAGLTREEIEACLQDEGALTEMTRTYQRHAEHDGINSTPSFIINGVKHGNMSLADFTTVLDAAYAEATAE